MTGPAASPRRTGRSPGAGVTSTRALRVVEPADWDPLVTRLGGADAYLCAAYHAASALLEPAGTRPVLLHHRSDRGELALPLLLRPLEAGGWDATSAYGYGGPVASGEPDIPAFGAALDAWAVENAVVTTFLRLHPLLDNAHLVPAASGTIDAGSTVAWDVSPGRDLVRGMHRNHKKAVRKAAREGLATTVVARPPDLDGLQALYVTTMERQQADPFFFFPDAYWTALLAPNEVMTPVLVEGRREDRLIASLLCLAAGPWLHAHLAGWEDEARSIGASNRCYFAAAEWGQQQGLTGFHLGGGVGGDAHSSLYEFKRRFDPAAPPRTFRIAKLVHDPARYRELTGSGSTAGFFPPWRAREKRRPRDVGGSDDDPTPTRVTP